MRPFHNTRKAIADYDRACEQFQDVDFSNYEETMSLLEDLDILARIVGIRFGWETKDINNPVTCADCIRPGSAEPPPGYETSFVRIMVSRE